MFDHMRNKFRIFMRGELPEGVTHSKYHIDGTAFTLPSGIEIHASYGYVRATGKYKSMNDVEYVQFYDCGSEELEYLEVRPSKNKEPFWFLTEL